MQHEIIIKLHGLREKEEDAYQFAKKYRNDIPGFLEYIKESDFAVGSDYKESWKYITEELHSLERHTNLGVCLEISENGDL